MFTSTELGRFLTNYYYQNNNGGDLTMYPFLHVSLLLAEIELSDSPEKRILLLAALEKIYGDRAEWTAIEKTLPQELLKQLHCITKSVDALRIPKVMAYLRGILDYDADFSDFNDELSISIYRRQRRIFHKEKHTVSGNDYSQKIVCLLGLKGSGKSTIIKDLSDRGENVLEIYYEISRLKISGDCRVDQLPPPPLWRDEPLRLAMDTKGYIDNLPPTFYIGSLLRHSEISWLYSLGKPIFIYISASNRIRHKRARRRGREIERQATDSALIELDAHRDGLWPGYETNDVGGLISQSLFTVTNEQDDETKLVADEIQSIVQSKGG